MESDRKEAFVVVCGGGEDKVLLVALAVWNLPCRPDWPQIQRFACLSHSSYLLRN